MSDQAAQEAAEAGGETEQSGKEFREAYRRYSDTLVELQAEWHRALRSSYAAALRLQLETWLKQIGVVEPGDADEAQDVSHANYDPYAAAWSSIDGPKKLRAAYRTFLQEVQSAWSTANLEQIDTALLSGIGNSLIAAAHYAQGIEREPA